MAAFLTIGCAFGQIGYPGQYPGQYPGRGRYPQGGSSSPFPGRGKKTATNTQQDAQVPLTTITGILRRISNTELVVGADDKRIVTLALTSTTKYYKAGGGSGTTSDFQPGDHLTVDATRNDKGYYSARNVTQVKVGTAEERAAASEPVDSSPIAGAAGDDSDDDRPRLRRGSGAGGPESPITPQIAQGDSNDSQTVARNEPAGPAPSDPNDPGPPKLKRGAQERRASSDTSSPNADLPREDVKGVKPSPEVPEIPNSGDAVLDKAREAALTFSESLPNYVVKQFTTRYQSEAARRGETSWHALDTISADVVSEGGKDKYKNILVNGKPPKEAVEKSGSWSTGEFSSVLLDVLSPATDADFHNKRSSSIANHAAWRYDFTVDQANSHWHVYSAADSYKPEYTGTIWIDKENSRVLRIELSARNMPKAFPLDTVESAVDYDYVLIGERKFLLPVHSEALSCGRGTSFCSRNVIDFRNYKKFGADTSVTFEPTPDK
jgi:hypothetical protein